MADILIIDAATGEITERDFTPEEQAQRDADAAAYAAAEAAAAAAEAERAAARESAIAKLASLGLSEVEVAALLGGQS
jgi:hypothetical protein